MQHLKGRRVAWIIVAIAIIALVAGLIIQRTLLSTPPSPYQTRIKQAENQGYSPQQAAYIASANVTVISSNSSYADMIVNFPSNVSAEVTIEIFANQTFTPTQAEVDNNTNGIYNVTFSYDNTSFRQELNLSYFLSNSSLSTTATAVPASILFGSMGLNVLSIFNSGTFPSQSASREPGYTMLNSGGGGPSHNLFHILEQIKVGLNSVKAIGEALAINQEYTEWLKQLNELQDCAENPTNPVTINGYKQDPGQEQQILDQIANAKTELAALTIARFVNVAVSLGAEGVKNLGVDVLTLLSEHYSEETLKQLSEEQVQNIEKLVTPCSPTSTSSGSTTTQTTSTTDSSSSTLTTSESTIHGDFYGNFEWKLDAGSGYVEKASGSFSFSINPSNNSISGSGTGFVTDNLGSPSPCTASGSGSYSFAVTGTFQPFNNNMSLQFDYANPQTVSAPETCGNVVETATWNTGTGAQPSNVMISATDGATIQCPPSCLGSQLTYRITLSTTPLTTTFSSTSFPSTTTLPSTSSESSTTTTITSTETSSTTSGTTLTISTSTSVTNSTSTTG